MQFRIFLSLFFLAAFPCCGEAKTYDCFLFFNEFEILDIRLHELYDHVDKFVLVECVETFRGNSKPLYYEENKERYAAFADKIIHIIVKERISSIDPWVTEEYQRNQIMRGLVDCSPEDIIILSDVDEILNSKKLPHIISQLTPDTPAIGCHHTMYRFYLNAEDHIVPWIGTVVTNFENFSKDTPENIRKNRWNIPYSYYAGWHFTSMGGLAAFCQKMEAFSHIEEDYPENKTIESMLNYMQKHCTLVPVNDYYPAYVRENLNYFKEIGYIFDGKLSKKP